MKNTTKLLSALGLALTLAVGTVQAGPDRGPKKGPSKGKPSKEWFEAAKKKREASRKDAAKRGHKIRGRGDRGSFGKLFKSDEKLAELRKAFEANGKSLREKSKGLWEKYKAAEGDEGKAKLREELKALRGEHAESAKKHRAEVTARLKELGVEFKNDRKAQIDNERKGDRRRRGKGDKPGE